MHYQGDSSVIAFPQNDNIKRQCKKKGRDKMSPFEYYRAVYAGKKFKEETEFLRHYNMAKKFCNPLLRLDENAGTCGT